MQGAATGLASLECWAVFNQGIQAPAFLFSFFFSSVAKRRDNGHGHTGWQKGLTLADWKIESQKDEFFSSSVKISQLYKATKNDQDKETSFPVL